jgi:BirA family biotin operon repressor/biotin-[acetyl-CoA-carboxylase] ligase
VKWPNDLLLDGSKLAGVLTESRFLGSTLSHAVVGFGLNVAVRPEEVPVAPGGLPPTSLAAALGRDPGRLEILAALLLAIDEGYDRLWQGARDTVWADWRERLVGIGNEVRVETEAGPRTGLFEDVGRDGALLLRTAHGTERILAGDVTLGPRPV